MEKEELYCRTRTNCKQKWNYSKKCKNPRFQGSLTLCPKPQQINLLSKTNHELVVIKRCHMFTILTFNPKIFPVFSDANIHFDKSKCIKIA